MPARKYLFLLSLTYIAACPITAHACTPVPGVIYTAFGATAWGAFALKSVLGILLIVIIKAVLFSRFAGFQFGAALFYVFIANIFSTIPGFFAIPMFGPLEMLIMFPIQIGVCLLPAERIGQYIKIPKSIIVILLMGCLYLCNFLFSIAIPANAASAFKVLLIEYWPLKIVATLLAVCFGLAITSGYEEAVIHWMRKKIDKDDTNYLKPVVRANAYAMLIAVTIAAAIAIPQRLQTDNYLLSGLKAIYRLIAYIG